MTQLNQIGFTADLPVTTGGVPQVFKFTKNSQFGPFPGTWAAAFATEEFDPANIASLPNAANVSVSLAGYYRIDANVASGGNTADYRFWIERYNSGGVSQEIVHGSLRGHDGMTVGHAGAIMACNASDYFVVWFRNASGGINPGVDFKLWGQRLGPLSS